jgi:hypothetical protein
MSRKFKYYDKKKGGTSRRYQAVMVTTNAVNKKGKLKGKNKKEKKLLKESCCHHIYNKHHKLKATFHDAGPGVVVCELCGREIPVAWVETDKIKEICDPVLSYANQAVTGAVAANLGEKVVDYMVNFKVSVEEFPKYYKKTIKVLNKQDRMRKKKNRKNNGGGSTKYGSWVRSNNRYS